MSSVRSSGSERRDVFQICIKAKLKSKKAKVKLSLTFAF
jgi:hypothetical protein